MMKENKRILLFVDNCTAPLHLWNLKNIKLEFFLPNFILCLKLLKWFQRHGRLPKRRLRIFKHARTRPFLRSNFCTSEVSLDFGTDCVSVLFSTTPNFESFKTRIDKLPLPSLQTSTLKNFGI